MSKAKSPQATCNSHRDSRRAAVARPKPTLARLACSSEADPLELAITLATSRFLTILGRLPESNDFIERSLLACRGLFIWPAKLITALQLSLGSAASAGASHSFDENEDDEASADASS